MSVKLLSFAFSIDLQPSEKLVFLAICDSANDENYCWPNLSYIAKKCSMSIDGVSRILIRLEKKQLLTRKKRFGKSTIYTVSTLDRKRSTVENDQESTQFRPGVEYSFDPESKDNRKRTINGNVNPPIVPPLKNEEQIEELSGCKQIASNLHQNSAPETEISPISHNSEKKEHNEFEDAVDLFNQCAERMGIPKVQKFTETRRRRLAARLKDCGGIDGWKAALEKFEAIPAMRGQAGNGWKADFDFLMQEKSFTKLMEGAYDNWGRKQTRSDRTKQQLQEWVDGR